MYSEKFIYFQKFREMFHGVAVITLSQVPQQSLNSGSSQMQIMLTACWRFVMMKTFGNYLRWKWCHTFSVLLHKTIHH